MVHSIGPSRSDDARREGGRRCAEDGAGGGGNEARRGEVGVTRTTDATIGLLIANASRQGIITRADAEKVAEVFETISIACQAEIDRGDIDLERWRHLMHRGQVCEGIRYAIEDRLNGGPKLKGKETEG